MLTPVYEGEEDRNKEDGEWLWPDAKENGGRLDNKFS